jgi:hypothetical protein
MDMTSSGGITLSDVIKWLAGENWASFTNDNGAGLRLLDSITNTEVT